MPLSETLMAENRAEDERRRPTLPYSKAMKNPNLEDGEEFLYEMGGVKAVMDERKNRNSKD